MIRFRCTVCIEDIRIECYTKQFRTIRKEGLSETASSFKASTINSHKFHIYIDIMLRILEGNTITLR